MYGIHQGSFKDHVLSTPGWRFDFGIVVFGRSTGLSSYVFAGLGHQLKAPATPTDSLSRSYKVRVLRIGAKKHTEA